MAKSLGSVTCDNCGNEILVNTDFNIPNTRAKITPINNIICYRITSEQIINHLVTKIDEYKTGAKLKATVDYCENKYKSPNKKKGYAVFKVAVTDDILEKKDDDWYHQLGNINSVKITETILVGFIRKFGYDKREIDGLFNYKNLEYVENEFGMTKSFIENIKAYVIPKKIVDNNGKTWIVFSAKTDEIIKDMLSDPKTNKLNGRIEIRYINQINKDSVELIVYVHTGDVELYDDPIVRQLLGNNKSKK
jgi:hypothetical protein